MISTTPKDRLDIHDIPPLALTFGQSAEMAVVRERLERIARTDVPVLLQGESGTGKEVLARFLHLFSRRCQHPMIKVRCPSIPSTLIESELFGYEKGAFTGAGSTKRGRVELADQGTLFLDEVGSLNIAVQAKLLQVLQDGSFMRVGGLESRHVNARLVCADNQNLLQNTENGSFRLDFLYRINAITINMPPLRNRREDIPMLVDHFLSRYAKVFQHRPQPLSPDVMRLMCGYHWPGNIRQLENMIRSYVLIDSEEVIVSELVSSAPSRGFAEIDLSRPFSLKQLTKGAVRDMEREVILKVLQAHEWNRLKTAKWLNISYRSLLYKLESSNVSRPNASARETGAASAAQETRPVN